jgi:hypothetical protein
MAFDYSGIVATASRLIGEFGKTTAFIRVTGVSTSDPVTGTVTPDVPVDTPVEAVQVKQNELHTPGALIQDGDLFWVLDGRANIEDELLANDVLYNVVQVWPIVPGDTFIACRIQTRGGVKVAVAVDAVVYEVELASLVDYEVELATTTDYEVVLSG